MVCIVIAEISRDDSGQIPRLYDPMVPSDTKREVSDGRTTGSVLSDWAPYNSGFMVGGVVRIVSAGPSGADNVGFRWMTLEG